MIKKNSNGHGSQSKPCECLADTDKKFTNVWKSTIKTWQCLINDGYENFFPRIQICFEHFERL